MKRRIEQSFLDYDKCIQLDMTPGYQIDACSKRGKYERDNFISICPAWHNKFIDVSVMIFNKTATHDNYYSFNNLWQLWTFYIWLYQI